MKKPSVTDLFGDEISQGPAQEASFAELFQESQSQGGSRAMADLKVGADYSAEILSIGKDESFVTGTAGLDAQIATRDLRDPSGNLLFKVGDMIRVKVIRRREAELVVKRTDAVSSSDDTADSLEDAFDLEIPVKGRVSEEVKGGYRIELTGGVKAFCPYSQIALARSTDSSEYVGKSFEFLITQLERRNVVVSRRKLLELQRAESEGAFLLSAQPGDRFTGTITRLERFGAFCRLENGLEGLIPLSELAWGRVQNPSEVVSVGQAVNVVLLKVEEDESRLKLALSLKQAGEVLDPWLTIEDSFRKGVIYKGTVEKKEVYGLFVGLAPGVTGLLPKSSWRDDVNSSQYETKKRGDSVEVAIDHIDRELRRMSLKPPGDSSQADWLALGAKQAQADRSRSLGTLGDLLKGAQEMSKAQGPKSQRS